MIPIWIFKECKMKDYNLKSMAIDYYNAGLNILPAIKKMKMPSVKSWKKFQYQRPSFKEINDFSWNDSICVLGGPTSGNLFIIDFDIKGILFEEWENKCKESSLDLESIIIERSQSGGLHIAYRIIDSDVKGNLKLAYLQTTKENHPEYKEMPEDSQGFIYPCAIETRGMGGLCLISPSPGYELIQGDWNNVPSIASEESDLMLEIAMGLNQKQGEEKVNAPVKKSAPVLKVSDPNNSTAADYIRDNGLARIFLEENGWVPFSTKGKEEFYTRPGKESGISGAMDTETQYFYCFTTNGGNLEGGKGYTPLALYAAFYTSNDLKKASKDLHERFNIPYSQLIISNPQEEENINNKYTLVKKEEEKIKEDPFPEGLLDIGGMIQKIMDYTNSINRKYQPILSFAGALAFMSFAIARRIRYKYGGRSNIYIIALSDSGTGKNAARKTNKKLLTYYNSNAFDPETFESRQAFSKILYIQKQLLSNLDEFGQYLNSVTGFRPNMNFKQTVDEWLRLYSSADDDSYLSSVKVSESESKNQNRISQPSFTLYATTTRMAFSEAITPAAIQHGFIPRCIVLEGNSAPKRMRNLYMEKELPEDLIKDVEDWHKFRTPPPIGSPDPFVISPSEDAEKIFDDYEDEVQESQSNSEENNYRELYSRVNENAVKIAMILASSRIGPHENKLIIEKDIAELAVSFSRWSTSKVISFVNNFMAENEIDRFTKEIKRWIINQYGNFSKSEFSRRFQKIPKRLREEIIETLVEQNFLQKKNKESKSGPKKTVFWLENKK